MADLSEIQPRMLMGSGPSDVAPSVLEAMGLTTIGPDNIAGFTPEGIPVEAFSHLVRPLL